MSLRVSLPIVCVIYCGCSESSKDFEDSPQWVEASASGTEDALYEALQQDRIYRKDQIPLSVSRYVPRVPLLEPEPDFGHLSRLLWPSKGTKLSTVLHALHAFQYSPELCPNGRPSIDELKRVLLDNRVSSRWFGTSYPIVRTRYGLRFATPESAEDAAQAHNDQALASMAELGIATDEVLHVSDGQGLVADLLSDATETFQLRGEFEWSTIVRVLYFPDCYEWKNRYGESFTFDQVSNALIAKPLDEGSCSGTHTLHALTLILRVSEDRSILSSHAEDRLRKYLTEMSSFVSRQQLSDGSISPLWNIRLVSEPWYHEFVEQGGTQGISGKRWEAVSDLHQDLFVDFSGKVLVTSHHLEWLFYLPEAQQPDAQFFAKANEFLHTSLSKTDTALKDPRNYCPFSHSFVVVKLIHERSR